MQARRGAAPAGLLLALIMLLGVVVSVAPVFAALAEALLLVGTGHWP